jgi:hypothetical protein
MTVIGVSTHVSNYGLDNITVEYTLPSGLVAGDLMFLAAQAKYGSTSGNPTLTVSSGWTQLVNQTYEFGSPSPVFRVALWYRFYVGGDSNPTITSAGVDTGGSYHGQGGAIKAYRGVTGGLSTSAISTHDGSGSGNWDPTVPACSASQVAFLMVMGIPSGGGGTWTPPTGWTASGDGTNAPRIDLGGGGQDYGAVSFALSNGGAPAATLPINGYRLVCIPVFDVLPALSGWKVGWL